MGVCESAPLKEDRLDDQRILADCAAVVMRARRQLVRLDPYHLPTDLTALDRVAPFVARLSQGHANHANRTVEGPHRLEERSRGWWSVGEGWWGVGGIGRTDSR